MDLIGHFRAMAANNLWSNHRLLGACARLSAAELAAPRVSFFPSLVATLNHLLTVDWFYIDALEAGGRGRAVYAEAIPCPEPVALAAAQRAADVRLLAFCDALTPAGLERSVTLDRGPRGIRQEAVAAVLAHLFVHQIHHRGQAHAMLAGTAVPPPQLDEFFLDEDLPRRAAELDALGLAPATGP